MQSTRTANTIRTPKFTVKKRAGSLSAEKLAQVQQQLFYDDLSYNSSPSNHQYNALHSPESLPSTEATLQHYNSQYYNSQNRVRGGGGDSKISNLDSNENIYSKVSPIPYKVPYSKGAENNPAVTSSARTTKTAVKQQQTQMTNTLDLEVIMPPEAKELCSDLVQLTMEERKVAMIVDENTFSNKIQQEIDCVGCVSSLHTYLYQLSELANTKPGNVLYFEGFVVYGDRRIGFSEEKVGDIHNIAYILHHHKSKNSIIDELTRSLNIKKKNEGHAHKGRVLSRCLLHSKKPMPNGIWREALQNLIEHDINEVASVAELDESVFISNLQAHTKRRKFCSQCKENIMYVYSDMLEEASNCSDCEDGVEEDEEEEEEEEEEEYEDNGEESPIEGPELDGKIPNIKTEAANKPNSSGDNASMNEVNEAIEHREVERQSEGRMISYSRKSSGALLACLKYCPERRKIAIPLEMEIFMEFLSKAESGITMHTKHANTKEAAQEELVACIGTCLKERLQSIWRMKKSEELARILFMKLAADCVIDGIRNQLEEKNYRLGHKTILEEYLHETEAAEQQRKEKLRQKRQKRKEKKKILKQTTPTQQGEGGGDENVKEEEEEEEPVEEKKIEQVTNKDEKEGKKNKKGKHSLKEEESNTMEIKGGVKVNKEGKAEEPPGKSKGINQETKATKEVKEKKGQEGPAGGSKEEMKIKKGKVAIGSSMYDKVSTDSNTPETEKSVEKNAAAGSQTQKNQRKMEEEEKTVEKKKKNEEKNNNKRNNRFLDICDERERSLLLAMGWSEEISESESAVDEKEIKKLKEKWNEIAASRADFRKSAKEKFMRLVYSK